MCIHTQTHTHIHLTLEHHRFELHCPLIHGFFFSVLKSAVLFSLGLVESVAVEPEELGV